MKILFISLGCDKNLVDTEVMLGMLEEEGYSFTDDEVEAEAVVINTCCFINDAKEESINTILEMSELKKSGQIKALIVAGCLAQRYQKEIQEEIPEVDAIIGTSAMAASMGSFLLAGGAKGKRFALPNAEIMIHQPAGGTQGQATEIEIAAKHILRTKEKLNHILAENTGRDYEQICADTERDNWMSAEEAREYGIIDMVISSHDTQDGK